MSEKQLIRSHDKMFAGVAAGVAEYTETDPTIVRLLFVLAALFGNGFGILVYLALMFIMPPQDPIEAKWDASE